MLPPAALQTSRSSVAWQSGAYLAGHSHGDSKAPLMVLLKGVRADTLAEESELNSPRH